MKTRCGTCGHEFKYVYRTWDEHAMCCWCVLRAVRQAIRERQASDAACDSERRRRIIERRDEQT